MTWIASDPGWVLTIGTKKKMLERVSDQEVRGEIGPDVNLAYNYHEQQTR